MNLGTVDNITKADGTAAIPVASTGTVYTPHFPIGELDALGVHLKAAGTTINVKVELEQSMVVPTSGNEEAADANNFVEPAGMPDIAVLGDSNLVIKEVTPVPTKYGRFKMTGQGSNSADVTVTIKLFAKSKGY